MPGPSRLHSVPPRWSGQHHTQCACVRRYNPASKEPTKQNSRLLMPNIMSQCSVCLIGISAARPYHSASSFWIALPHRHKVFCQVSSTPQEDAVPDPGWSEGLLFLFVKNRELPGCIAWLRALLLFWEEVAALGGSSAAKRDPLGIL